MMCAKSKGLRLRAKAKEKLDSQILITTFDLTFLTNYSLLPLRSPHPILRVLHHHFLLVLTDHVADVDGALEVSFRLHQGVLCLLPREA
mmetsp:Transcript_33313/g.32389  ORF Transcript_33313/g.32389 Transcript_33313/m.32389 type:complete len:89 (+) Transcript_33313:73-339(+)